jgi:pimeloyl-ACP methyl ester carboxylesterase
MSRFKVESLLSARLFLQPQLAGGRIYFISDLSGRLSLYGMDQAGSVPEPLLPPEISLMTPSLMEAMPFCVFPKLGKIIVMIDKDGDENYQPMVIPLAGGIPEPLFPQFEGMQLQIEHADGERNLFILGVDYRKEAKNDAYRVDLAAGNLTLIGSSPYGYFVAGGNDDLTRLVAAQGYEEGDVALFLWDDGEPLAAKDAIFGKPLSERAEGEKIPLNGITSAELAGENGVLLACALFDDRRGLAYFEIGKSEGVRPVEVTGARHTGNGEMESVSHLAGDRYLVQYNIDGATWAYEGSFDTASLRMTLDTVVCGDGPLSHGVAESIRYDKGSDTYAISFSTATSPAQLITVAPRGEGLKQLTRNRVLGIPQELLAGGEDAGFASHDGLHVPARLYLPAPEMGFEGKRPVVVYIHGGPQGQERPDFTWFSMPLIQFLTLNGLAVFVPNVRGSHGYGLDYIKRVDRDWGGLDRLDHVAGLASLRDHPRVDTSRAGVVGRSYGGYMTLMQVGMHPDLWSAAVDMFGPFNLLSFLERIPETWKPYFDIALGNPVRDRDFLVERSPSAHLHRLACPMLVIQGRNDPRVVAAESEDLVRTLQAQGKEVALLLFENEGHDVTKFENKVRAYTEITRFFAEKLGA